MPRFNVYNQILQHGDEAQALEIAAQFPFECETVLQDIKYAEHIDTIGDVGVYYDYGADYYFFTDEVEDIH